MSYTHDEATGCWSWTGPVTSDAYPALYRGGQQHLAARVLYAETYGPLPAAFRLRRACQTPACVNPAHHVVQAPHALAERLGFSGHDISRGRCCRGWRRWCRRRGRTC